MKLILDSRKSVQENAASHYQRSKELAKKADGAKKAIKETEALLADASVAKEKATASEALKKPSMRRKKEWFEKFRWFHTSGNRLVVAGRDAKQNDLLVAKTMADDDLFFHADIQGAPATILQDGKKAAAEEKAETAQFAASHSSAWKVGVAAVDVYAVTKGQLSKHAQGGYVGAGGFAIAGEREWFRATALGLAVGEKEGEAICLPLVHPDSGKMRFSLTPGAEEKGKAAKNIAGAMKISPDSLLLALPSGRFRVVDRQKAKK